MAHAPRIPYTSVVCALDDTDEAEAVLKAAAAFACEYNANLWLVQAIETPPATLEIDFSPPGCGSSIPGRTAQGEPSVHLAEAQAPRQADCPAFRRSSGGS